MKIRIKKLEQSMMSYSGSNVLQSIMDISTPGVDLLVRESIQNSTDAILNYNNSIQGKIDFSITSFNADLFLDLIEDDISTSYFQNVYSGKWCNCLIISDSNTTGLYGSNIYNPSGNNNFYNLVYDVGNGKSSTDSGGSWGYGKSVYYRFGEGIVFYYTKTNECVVPNEKLAGVLIVDEKEDNCVLGKNSRGIAFYGDFENGDTKPIYSHEFIKEFLNVFGLDPYDDKTGTVVIIPFLNADTLIPEEYNGISVERGIREAIQKWYFPRLNNQMYNGHSFSATVNGKIVTLNKFYQRLQDLYNGTIDNYKSFSIVTRSVSGPIGTLLYKSFSSEELGIFTPPDNIDSPYNFLLLENDKEGYNKGIVCYTRKPGMIINYDSNKFGNNYVDSEHYLFAIFKLNDEALCCSETAGEYFRGTERANHMEWIDSNVKNCPQFTKIKPFNRIYTKIKKQLGIEYSIYESKMKKTVDNGKKISKILGKVLLPNFDYGNENNGIFNGDETISRSRTSVTRKKSCSFSFDGFNNGHLQYTFTATLQDKKKINIDYEVCAEGYKIPISKWEEMGFDLPYCISRIDFVKIVINGNAVNMASIIVGDDKIVKSYKIKDALIVSPMKSTNNKVYGIKLTNVSLNPIVFIFKVFVKPIDITYSIDVKINQL